MTMGAVWFGLVAAMLVAYVVLDGFDIGVGILHVLLARTESERQLTLRSIGPVWDGNEVWLVAAGGTLYFAFPLLYASAFSGFYLALMIVLWLIILRGLAIELRMELHDAVWRTFFDATFFLSSALLAVFYGVALANVIRGVPLTGDSDFFVPLWTNWRVGPNPGILDWYTVTAGVLALVALTIHGALYLSVKTDGDLQRRARVLARRSWIALVCLTVASLAGSVVARPTAIENYRSHPVLFAIPLGVLLTAIGIAFFSRRNADGRSFACSCGYLAFMLAGAAAALYPRLLPSSRPEGSDITIANALAGPHTVHVGLVWWGFGIGLAIVYFVVVYRSFWGKVTLDGGANGQINR
ncbi:MAG TPA: cytochrome d ubiquinol oxidase subunit II [Vicinamibacterales bacterium]|nr:cytochrome d ubiquinol oxidase subunit II [Vicinamibacterales bacterium]